MANPNRTKHFVEAMLVLIIMLTLTTSFVAIQVQQTIDSATTSDTIDVYYNLTLRPNGDSGINGWITHGTGTGHYSFVDETVSDEETTYLDRISGSHFSNEFFDMTNHTDETGTVVNVTSYAVAKCNGVGETNTILGFKIADDRNLVYEKVADEDAHVMTTDWVIYSYTWETSWNDTAWTWGQVDNLSYGMLGSKEDLNYTMVTQSYVVVNYYAPVTTYTTDPILIGVYSLLPFLIFAIIVGIVYYAYIQFIQPKKR